MIVRLGDVKIVGLINAKTYGIKKIVNVINKKQ